MTALGEYADDDTSSTLKHCDHKEAKDLVVPDVAPTVTSKWAKGSGGPAGSETGNMVLDNPLPAWGMYGPSGQEGATEEEQPTITGSHGQPGNVAVPQAFDGYNQTLGDTAQTIRADKSDGDHVGMVMVPQAFRKAARAQSSEDSESWVNDGGANTLNVFDVGDTRTTHAIVEQTYSLQGSMEGRSDTAGPGGKGWKEDESFTLNTADRHSVVAPSHAIVGPQSFDEMNFTTDGDTHHVLRAGTKQSTGAITEYGVRRLTPVECERLQSFPDGWTEPSGSDSARYKAMGNAVTVNVVRWILGRMLNQSGQTVNVNQHIVKSGSVKAAAMLNFQGSKGNNVTNDGTESFTLNAMHGHDVHAVVVEQS